MPHGGAIQRSLVTEGNCLGADISIPSRSLEILALIPEPHSLYSIVGTEDLGIVSLLPRQLHQFS